MSFLDDIAKAAAGLASGVVAGAALGGGKSTSIYTGGGSGAGGKSGSSSSSAVRGGGGGGISAAERRAIARENAAKRKASARYIDQAKTLQKQADALKKALEGGYKEALDKRLSNVDLVWKQQDQTLLQGYQNRVGSLAGSKEDNDKAESDATFSNLANRSRERSNAMSEALMQGAGESDVMRAQLMSLRNWNANQSEVNRSYFDTLRSINSSLSDLNVDTRTARLNTESQANADRDQLWTQYYNQMSDSYTQLGNIYGQQAELYGMANEQVSKSSSRSSQKSKSKSSGSAFSQASKMASSAYVNPGNSKELTEWKGEDNFIGNLNNTILAGARGAGSASKRPEGASLRSW